MGCRRGRTGRRKLSRGLGSVAAGGRRNRSDREFGREAIASFSREDAKGHEVGTPRRRMAGIEPATGVANHILSEPF